MLFGLTDAALSWGVAALLWGLSVSSWVVIGYKTWWVWRTGHDVVVAQEAFWESADPEHACQSLALLDRHAVLLPLARHAYPASRPLRLSTAAWAAELMGPRRVVQALRQLTQRVQWGQAWLACVASAAPFIGLLGTVWGLVAGLSTLPSDEAGAWERWVPALSQTLSLTAAGLLVALPALVAHHLLAARLSWLQEQLDDFAAELIDQVHRTPHSAEGPPQLT